MPFSNLEKTILSVFGENANETKRVDSYVCTVFSPGRGGRGKNEKKKKIYPAVLRPLLSKNLKSTFPEIFKGGHKSPRLPVHMYE